MSNEFLSCSWCSLILYFFLDKNKILDDPYNFLCLVSAPKNYLPLWPCRAKAKYRAEYLILCPALPSLMLTKFLWLIQSVLKKIVLLIITGLPCIIFQAILFSSNFEFDQIVFCRFLKFFTVSQIVLTKWIRRTRSVFAILCFFVFFAVVVLFWQRCLLAWKNVD